MVVSLVCTQRAWVRIPYVSTKNLGLSTTLVKQHNYIPDWIVNNEYVEIKGYWTEQWQAKLDQFPKEEKLLVLTKTEMQPYIDYVVEKYGKGYIKLYE